MQYSTPVIRLAEIVKFDGLIKDSRNKFRQKQAYARAL